MTTHVSSLEELSKTLDVPGVTYDYSNDEHHKNWKAIIPVTTGCGNEDMKCLSYTKGVFTPFNISNAGFHGIKNN